MKIKRLDENLDKILEKLKSVHLNNIDFNFPENEYLKLEKLKIDCKCNTCNYTWRTTYQISYHDKGKCLVCSGKKLTLEKALSNLYSKYGTKFLYCIDKWETTNTKFKVKCNDCNSVLEKNYNNLYIGGFSCKKCLINSRKFNLETIKENIQKVHGNKYKFISYKNNGSLNNSRIIMECPKHNNWETKYERLVREKRGCPYCAGKKLNHVDINEFIENLTNNTKYEFFCKDPEPCGTSIIVGNCKIHGRYEKSYFNMKQSPDCPKCRNNTKEDWLLNLFKEYNIESIYNSRQIIKPLEIDVFVPKYNFGIEHNGLIWHSFGKYKTDILNNYHKLDRNKHLNKTLEMEKIGYQLFHIREDHLIDEMKMDIWKSILLNKCNISHKIHARKLKVINLENYPEFVNDFLKTNHLQGYINSTIKLGLQDPKNGIIYSIMTFGKSRFNKNIEYELLRFCNIKFHTIRGAASKLLKYFERTYKPQSLISYANRDWSQGNLYKQLGFEFIEATNPNYIYTNDNRDIISRLKVQKHKLKEFLGEENFDENLSERDNMINNGYRIYYDTGNLSFQKIDKGN